MLFIRSSVLLLTEHLYTLHTSPPFSLPPASGNHHSDSVILNEISQTEKDKHYAVSIIYRIFKKIVKFHRNRIEWWVL